MAVLLSIYREEIITLHLIILMNSPINEKN